MYSKDQEESQLLQLKRTIKDQPVMIWGARAVGCGLCRAAERMKLNVVGFIDSDPCFQDKKILGYEVFRSEQFYNLICSGLRPFVITASTLSEDFLAQKCLEMGLRKSDFASAQEFCDCEYIIDVAGVCNLKCPSCPRGNYELQPNPGFITVDRFRLIVDKILSETPDVSTIALFNWGEPLLHPQLPKLINILRERKIFCSLSTNFNIVRDIKSVILAKPDMLKISLSGYYQHTYGIFHEKGDINLVKANMYKLRTLIDHHHPEMIVEVIYHQYRNNLQDDYAKMKDLCGELDYMFAACVAYFSPVEKIINFIEGSSSERDRKIKDLLLVDMDDALKKARSSKKGLCPLLEKQIVINWDGSVSLCCASFDPMKTLVNKDFLAVTSKEIKESKLKHPLCITCMNYGIDKYYSKTSQGDL